MQDPEQQYPRRQADDDREQNPYNEHEESQISAEPAPAAPASGGPARAITIGIVAGIVGALVSIGITLANSSTYQQVAQQGTKAPLSLDYIELGLTCIGIVISLLVCYFAGFITGHSTRRQLGFITGHSTRRQLGFYAGAAAGVVIFLGGFVTNWIPNYPGKLASQASTTTATFSGGIIISLIFLLVYLFVGGLIGLWGAGHGQNTRSISD
ncbi:MAG TPA: hypothetical protein VHZ51_14220 [Ktedonobacteraceae bacterium]|jgi:hypothetical protein|nr:hypothetical protein [Ktedonobacteraceae bacterium]